jgi:HK97 family phage major capsid protein
MATLKELRERVAKHVTEAREAVDQIKPDTPEDRAKELNEQADRALEDVRQTEAQIERLEKIEASQRKMEEAAEHEARAKRPTSDGGEAPGVDGGDEPSYREAFHEYLRCQGQMGDMRPEARSVLRAGYQKVEERAQTVGTNSAGGFTVPTELQNILIRSMLAFGPMYSEDVGTVITTSGGGQITMPTVDDTAVTAGAHTEGATLTDDGGKDVTFGQKVLDAFAFDTEWVRVSKELADDSIFAMEQLLGDLLGERLGRIANLQLTTGSGSSAPNGIATAAGAGVTAAGTAAVTYDEIIDLEHSVDPAYRQAPGVGYMFNDATLKVIRKLKDGDGNYLWQMGNVQAGIPGTLNGRRYIINQQIASLGASNKFMLFGDFKKYYVRKVGAPLIGALQDKDFWPGFGVAGYIRFDGELADAGAVKALVNAAA